jgi:hypothetical protein
MGSTKTAAASNAKLLLIVAFLQSEMGTRNGSNRNELRARKETGGFPDVERRLVSEPPAIYPDRGTGYR